MPASAMTATTTKTAAYQTASIVRLTVISIASPACITLLPMRPAKSFWKKVQDWRMTCQWLCQRTRSTRFGVSAWLRTRASATKKSGRSSTTASMKASVCQCSAKSCPGGVVESMPTVQPTKTGSMASASEPPATSRKRAIERAAELAQEVGEEGARRRRRLPVGGQRGRGVEVVEGRGDAVEHGSSHRSRPHLTREGSGSAPGLGSGEGRGGGAGVGSRHRGSPSVGVHSAASGTSPMSMKPPDWRFQKRA